MTSTGRVENPDRHGNKRFWRMLPPAFAPIRLPGPVLSWALMSSDQRQSNIIFFLFGEDHSSKLMSGANRSNGGHTITR